MQAELLVAFLYWTVGIPLRWVLDRLFPSAGPFLGGLLDSAYPADGIQQVLQETFGDRCAFDPSATAELSVQLPMSSGSCCVCWS